MKTILVSSALAAVLLLIAWLVWPEPSASTPTLAPTTSAVTTDSPSAPSHALSVESPTAPPTPREPTTQEESAEAPPEISATAPTGTRAKFDPNARGAVYFFVRDPEDKPIVDAEVRMSGLFCAQNPRATNEWIGEPSTGRTEPDGSIRLLYPKWIDPYRQTTHVSFRIEHREFVAFEAQGFPVESAPRIIVLQRGSLVVVTGWIGSPTDVVKDVKPHVSLGALATEAAWAPLGDGRLACMNFPPGRHSIYLSHSSPSRGPCFSEVTSFDLDAGERKELHLELAPGRGLKGKLADVVPRPVLGGRVLVNLAAGSTESSGAMMTREFTAEVRADGTFEFEALPPGAGQIVGICDGWASERVRSDKPTPDPRLKTLSKEEQEKKLALARDMAMVPQWVDPAVLEKPFELLMERTAKLHATVDDSKGRPIEHASVRIVANANWSHGQSSAFMHLAYAGVTDASGTCTIANVPRGVVFVDVQHEDYVVPAGGEQQVQMELEAGAAHDVRVVLEPLPEKE